MEWSVTATAISVRRENSWKLGLGEVSATEAAEALAINTLAPFVLNSRLKALLTPPCYRAGHHSGDHQSEQLSSDNDPDRDSGCYSYIINVSAMEGKFYRKKTAAHPHTNMAKAALNMMTRTSAQEYTKAGILMNSVDTGWINDENPAHIAARLAAEHGSHGFATPLDEVDAAARILDPVFAGVNEGQTSAGLFFKDYAPTEW
jgi:NAD(P)-dependent dehydrogenase (short-subunit alcohol dehydrogenase family)